MSSDSGINVDLARWAEFLAKNVEQAVGIELPHKESSMTRIIVRWDDEDTSGRAVIAQVRRDDKFIQDLIFYNLEQLSRGEAEEAFCSLLLSSYVEHLASVSPKQTKIKTVSRWLVQGLMHNLYPVRKAWSVQLISGKWSTGSMPTLTEFIRSRNIKREKSEASLADLEKAMSGMLWAWITSFESEEKKVFFEKLFVRSGGGEPLSPEWFVACIPGCGSIADLEGEWDNWILKQQRMVYQPGVVTQQMVDQFKAQLLLYPGDSGIDLSLSDSFKCVRFRDLIDLREAEWIPVFTQSKILSLQFCSIGRGKEFESVVKSYCEFLEALGKRKSKSTLQRLLDKADKALKDMDEKLSRETKTQGSGSP
ncbi:hypothetical protein ACFLS1_00645 [Verrucomicrobiota bacterium]